MAPSASRSIWRSSRCRWRGDSAWRGMASPLYPPAGDGKQILSNDAPSHIALESSVAFVGRSPHRKRMLQCADGGFTARSPAQRSLEPALLLPPGASGRQTSPPRQGDLLYPSCLRFALVLRREITSVGGGQPRRLPEQCLVLRQGGNPGVG